MNDVDVTGSVVTDIVLCAGVAATRPDQINKLEGIYYESSVSGGTYL